MAPATLERAAGTLIAEGVLAVHDRRGTFVAELPIRVPAYPAVAPATRCSNGALVATVGLVAAVVPYESGDAYEGQWSIRVLHGCEHQLAGEPGLTTRFVNTVRSGRPDLAVAAAAKQLLADGVDAIILIGLTPTHDLVEWCASAKVPCLLAAFHPAAALNISQVYIDGAAGGAVAARHLLDRGYRRLVYFCPFVQDWTEERLAGVKAVLANAADASRLRVVRAHPVKSVLMADGQMDLARKRARDILADDWEAGTGVIAPNDAVALGFMEAAGKRGQVAGRDYGIVGFDDRSREAHLTSLRPPLEQVGTEAAGLAVRLLRGDAVPARIALQHRLMARASSAAWGPRS